MNVFFYETFAEEEKLFKELLPKNISAQFSSQTIQERGDTNPPSEVISIRTQSEIPLSWKNQIKGVLARSRGCDHLSEFYKVSSKKVPCGYLKDYCARAVAEHAVLSMLVLLRKFKTQTSQMETFNRDGLTGSQCLGKNALIVGVGAIGKQVVTLAKAMGMNVKGVDPKVGARDVSYTSFKDGVFWADVIFCTASLTESSNRLLDYDALKQNKRRSVLVNVSRGEITPLNDLKRLLDENILSGAALDVYENEKELAVQLRNKDVKEDSLAQTVLELNKRDNVLFTPHNAFNTAESTKQKVLETISSLEFFLKKGNFPTNISQNSDCL